MKTRKIINIDEEKCNGCGNCVTGCHEGALQIVDGVAKLVNEQFCDGFGDCIGECPTGALKIEERKAEEFDLEATKEHVENLRGEEAAKEMIQAQEEHAAEETSHQHQHGHHSGGCPGSRMKMMNKNEKSNNDDKVGEVKSQLEQWPVQIDLLSPHAPYFSEADLLITADCVPVAYGNYQQELKGKAVAMGCPKLDDAQSHVNKLASIIKENDLNSIKILRMEVPCCGGMVQIAEQALDKANSDLELEVKTIGINGEVSI
ncbi:ATP-binding protein [Halanaerobacter jeridensis]|uniref:NAD-dependent dihydropyrimidine dehydrogenase PreA subunit n=1 Tax=Halanaerobacter jeridensis TaxID=706427 RepID=A0A938XNK1_9FIRM|nr:4Fe-4S dicluster domain-containing protein [Halanaerobacter jeridensis]MBM7555883.1 NAD-dependent dihydropyrimidine dehydrogenase PreA subunit [Halanaerobacter jeridensis]